MKDCEINVNEKTLETLSFPDSFFEDEVRDGFFVSGHIKRAWAAELKTLAALDAVCKKHHIRWFMDFGTLLGAVRHQGFVPWDDDMDICMLRSDYEKLFVFRDELPEGYMLLDPRIRKGYHSPFAELVNRDFLDFSPEIMQTVAGFPYVAGVDIYILDNVPDDAEEREAWAQEISIIRILGEMFEEKNRSGLQNPDVQDMILFFLEKYQQTPDMTDESSIQQALYTAMVYAYQQYQDEETHQLVYANEWLENRAHYCFDRSVFDRTKWLTFEGFQLPAADGCTAMLENVYGPHYMSPVRTGAAHDYPFYERYQGAALQYAVGKQIYAAFHYSYTPEVCATKIRAWDKMPADPVSQPVCQKKKALFIIAKTGHWEAAGPLWKACREDPDYAVTVLQVPYGYRLADGSCPGYSYDSKPLPAYAEAVRALPEVNEAVMSPEWDVIFTSYGEDGFGAAVQLSEEWWTDRLRQHCRRLVYVPWFYLDEIKADEPVPMKAASFFVNLPGLVFADLVLMQSEAMKEIYQKTLSTDMPDCRENWDEKLIVCGNPAETALHEAKRYEDITTFSGWEMLCRHL